ncbi:MAG: hypothetical protein DRP85_00030 [Candidatus Makaraimicrobium thalassicum]|nr:MAG: hypothetical protein DRP85_00030 [Candidatus Omnitrophota bacterium]
MKAYTRIEVSFKTVAVTVAAIFLWNQIVWAGDLSNYTPAGIAGEQYSEQLPPTPPGDLATQQTAKGSLISQKQAVEDFQNTQYLQTRDEAAFSITTEDGSTVYYSDNKIYRIEMPDGTFINNPVLDNENNITGAHIEYTNGTSLVVRESGIVSITDSEGKKFNYSDDGLVESVEYADGKVKDYTYVKDENDNIDQTIVSDNEKRSFYDSKGELRKVEVYNGETVEYKDGILSKITDNSGTVYLYGKTEAGSDGYRAVLLEIRYKGNIYYIDSGNITAVEFSDGRLIRHFRLDENGSVIDGVIEGTDGKKYTIENKRVKSIEYPQGIKAGYDYVVDEEGTVTACNVTVDDQDSVKVYKYTKDASSGDITIEEGNKRYCYNSAWTLKKFTDAGGTVKEYDAAQNLIRTVLADGTIYEYHTSGDFTGRLQKIVYPDGENAYFDYRVTEEGNLAVLKRRSYDRNNLYQSYRSGGYIDSSLNPGFKVHLRLDSASTYSSFYSGASYYKSGDRSVNLSLSIYGSNPRLYYYLYNYETGETTHENELLDITINKDTDYTVEYVWVDSGVDVYLYESSSGRPGSPAFTLEDNQWDPKFYISGSNAGIELDPSSSGRYVKSKRVSTDYKHPLKGGSVYQAEFFLDSESFFRQEMSYRIYTRSSISSDSIYFNYSGGTARLNVHHYDYQARESKSDVIPLDIAIKTGNAYIARTVVEDNIVKLYIYEKGTDPGEPVYTLEDITSDLQIYSSIYGGGEVDIESMDNLEIYEYDSENGDLVSRASTASGESLFYRYAEGEIQFKELRSDDGTKKIYDRWDRLLREEKSNGETTLYKYDENGSVISIIPEFPEDTELVYYQTGDFSGKLEKAVLPEGETLYYRYSITDEGNLAVQKRTSYKDSNISWSYRSTGYINYSQAPVLASTFKLDPAKPNPTFCSRAYHYARSDKYVNLSLNIYGRKPRVNYYSYDYNTHEYVNTNAEPDIVISSGTEYTVEYVWEESGVNIYLYESSQDRPEAPVYTLPDGKWDPRFSISGTNADIGLLPEASGNFISSQSIRTDQRTTLKDAPIHKTELSFDASAASRYMSYSINGRTDTSYESIYFSYYNDTPRLRAYHYDYQTRTSARETIPVDLTFEPGKSYIIQTEVDCSTLNLYIYEKGGSPGEPVYTLEDVDWSPNIYSYIRGGKMDVEAYDNLEIYEYNTQTGILLDEDVKDNMKNRNILIDPQDNGFFRHSFECSAPLVFPHGRVDVVEGADIGLDFPAGLPVVMYDSAYEDGQAVCPISRAGLALDMPAPEISDSFASMNVGVKRIAAEIGEVRAVTDRFYIRKTAAGEIYTYKLYGTEFYIDTCFEADGSFTAYEYEEDGTLAGFTRTLSGGDTAIYDLDGVLTSYLEYLPDGSIKIFDEDDNLIYAYEASNSGDQDTDQGSVISVTNPRGDTIRYRDGAILSVTFKEDGSTMSGIELDPDGNLRNAVIRYADGSTGIVYDGTLLQMILPGGTLVRYREGRKTTEYSDGTGLTAFRYIEDENGDILYITAINRKTTCIYDSDGKPVRFAGPDGKITEYENGYLKRIVTADGHEYLYEFKEGQSVLVSASGKDSVPLQVYYDENGQIRLVLDKNMDISLYEDGLLTGITRGFSNLWVNPNGFMTELDTTSYSYIFDQSNNVEKITVNRNGIERIYDNLGDLQSLALGSEAKIVYEDGQEQYIEKSDGTRIGNITFSGTGTISDGLISYPDGSVVVYKDNELLKSISRSGDAVDYSAGRISTVTLSDGSVYDWSYEGESVKIYDHAKDEYRWYLEGRLQKVKECGNALLVTNYYYDSDNKLIKSDIYSDNEVLCYSYSYSYEDDLTLVHDGDNNIQAYNADKKLIYIIDSKGRKYTYTYANEVDGCIKVMMPNLSEVRYDTNGDLIEIIRSDGTIIRDVIFDSGGSPTEFTYVKDGCTYTVKNGKPEEVITDGGTRIRYDTAGFITSIASVSGETEEYEYAVNDENFVKSADSMTAYTFDEVMFKKSSVQLATPFDYGSGTDGTLVIDSGETVYVDGEKQYESIYVAEGGILALSSWSGISGGLATLRCSGPVEIKGTIDARGTGYRGGTNDPAYYRNFGVNQSGESYNGLGIDSMSANYGGGGGGLDGQNHQPDAPSGCGGGGGGYGTEGTSGTPERYRYSPYQGHGGGTYGELEIDQLYRGSGGGSGGDYTIPGYQSHGGGGGAGGGAIQIIAPEIRVSGTICANGGDGQDGSTGGNGGAGGGGGSGGTVWLSGESIDLTGGSITAHGGKGGTGAGSSGHGGNGGSGRIRIDYAELTGELPQMPALYATQVESIVRGELLSSVIETNAGEYGTVSWSEDLPEGTQITFRTRTGQTPVPDSTWSGWSDPLTDCSGSRIISPAGKYIQYMAVFSTEDNFVTPKIIFSETDGIKVDYKRPQQDPSDIERLDHVRITRDGAVNIYSADGVNADDAADIIDTAALVFDPGYLDELKDELPAYILNETQRMIYLNNDISIAELKAIINVGGITTSYIQGGISEIKFSDDTTVNSVIFGEDSIPEEFAYVRDGQTYILKDSRIKEVITGEGARIEYDAAGFMELVMPLSSENRKFKFMVNDAYSAASMEELSYSDENIIYNGSSIRLETLFDYGSGADGALVVGTGETVYVDAEKQYESIYVAKGGVLVISPWDGVIGGLATLRCAGPVEIKGTIDARGTGYRGGTNTPAYYRNFGANQSGESYNGLGIDSMSANHGGGGGGLDGQNHQPDAPSACGGGGGGYGTAGASGTPERYRYYGYQGHGGNTYGEFEIDQLYRGSGGGAGGDYTIPGYQSRGGDGGAGGGAFQIIAPEIRISGTICANGGDGQDGSTGGNGGAGGGGGSGGTVWISGESIDLTGGSITADGGKGGTGAGCSGHGGNGGSGRIRIDYAELTGELPQMPALYATQVESIARGELLSNVIETNAEEYGTVSWSEDLPEGTQITFSTRTGQTSVPDPTWSGWSEPLTDCSGSRITSPAGKYIQYKVILSTTGLSVSPALNLNDAQNVRITYTRNSTDNEPIGDLAYVKVTDDFNKEISSHRLNDAQKIITVYDKTSDIPVQTVSADLSVTYYNEGSVARVEDKAGTLLVLYTYDSNKRLLKTEFVNAREKLEQGYQAALQDLATQKEEALAQLKQAEQDARDNIGIKAAEIQAQINAERDRLQRERSRYDPNVYDLSEFDRVFRELDEYEVNLAAQKEQAYNDLDNQIAEAKQNIENDAAQAMRDLLINDYNVVLGDIVQKESSPLIYYYYRNVLGRDPAETELEYWLNKAKAGLSATKADEITRYIQGLDEYSDRQNWKTGIIADVSSFFDRYLSADDSEKGTMLSPLGLSLDDVKEVNLTQEDIDSIVAWLEGQSLHFGDSAFKTIMDLLDKEGVTKTFQEIGGDCLKVDILAGVITAEVKGDLVISMFAMSRIAGKNGLTLHAEKIDFDELKEQLALNDRIILHVNRNHYVVLKDINEQDGTVTYKDLSVGAEGQDITMSRAEFMEEWAGYVLSGNQIINTENEKCSYLNKFQAKNIRGSGWWQKFWKGIVNFFQKIVAPVATVLLFVPGVGQLIGAVALGINILIQTVSYVVRTGTLMDVVWSVGTCAGAAAFGTIANMVGHAFRAGSIASTIFPGLKGAFETSIPLFESISSAVTNIATGIGNIFTPLVGEGIAASLVTHAIGTAVNMGSSFIFDSMKLDPTLSDIASALMTGLFVGMADPKIDAVASMLRSGTVQTGRELGEAAGLDPKLTELAAISAGALAGGVFEIDGKTHTTEDLLKNIALNMAGEVSYMGAQELGKTLGLDPRISYLAGIGIRSSLQMGFSRGGTGEFDVDKMWQGLQQGLLQGVSSLALNYTVQELNLPPLLANLGFAAIASGFEGLLIPKDPQHPGEGSKGFFENMIEKFTNGTLSLMGYNPRPDKANFKNPDGTIDYTSYNQAMGNYFWQESIRYAQVMEFSEIIRERGLEDALNTYATSLFNSIAVNSIANVANIGINEVGSYFKDKIEAYKINPTGTPEVTYDSATGEYKVGLKDGAGMDALVAYFMEKYYEGNPYYDLTGYNVPDKTSVFGTWGYDPYSNTAGQLQGYFRDMYGDDVEVYYEVDRDVYGMPLTKSIKYFNLDTGRTVIIRPIEEMPFVIPDSSGFFGDARVDIGWSSGINDDIFETEKTVYLLNDEVIASEENVHIVFSKDGVDPLIIRNGATVWKYINEDGTTSLSYKVNNSLLNETIKDIYFQDFDGNQVSMRLNDNGDVSLRLLGNELWVGNLEQLLNNTGVTNLNLVDGLAIPTTDPNMDYMRSAAIMQRGILNVEDSPFIASFDINKAYYDSHGIPVGGYLMTYNSPQQGMTTTLPGIDEISYTMSRGIAINHTANPYSEIVSDPLEPDAITVDTAYGDPLNTGDIGTVRNFTKLTQKVSGTEVELNGREVAYNVQIGDKTFDISFSVSSKHTLDLDKATLVFNTTVISRDHARAENTSEITYSRFEQNEERDPSFEYMYDSLGNNMFYDTMVLNEALMRDLKLFNLPVNSPELQDTLNSLGLDAVNRLFYSTN